MIEFHNATDAQVLFVRDAERRWYQYDTKVFNLKALEAKDL